MNRARAYVNRLVKIKQQEIEDSYHSAHLKEMKPINKRLMEHSETIIINHGKREMIKQVREIQIERENKMLLQKIADVMGKKGTYTPAKSNNIRSKVNKSLNENYRKRQQQNIQLENKRFLQRLQTKRPTINIQKMNREWVQNKNMLKRVSNVDFYLTKIQTSSRMRSITAQKLNKSKCDMMKLIKTKVIDGQKMLIKIQFVGDLLKIIGDPQDKTDIKIIQIPKEEAMILIEKDCKGKLQLLLEKLKYDTQSQTLYLVSENIEEQEIDFSEINPEMERIINKAQSNTKKKVDQERKDQQIAEKNKTNHSKKQKVKQTLQVEEQYIMNNKAQDKQIQKQQTQQIIQVSNKSETKISLVEEQQSQKNKSMPKQSKPVQTRDPIEIKKEIKNDRVQTKKDPIEIEGDHIEVKEAVKIQPQQQQKYEEQNFEQSNQKQQQKEAAEITKKQITEQRHENKKEIIVQPQQIQNYNEQFEASVQKIAQNSQKIKI